MSNVKQGPYAKQLGVKEDVACCAKPEEDDQSHLVPAMVFA